MINSFRLMIGGIALILSLFAGMLKYGIISTGNKYSINLKVNAFVYRNPFMFGICFKVREQANDFHIEFGESLKKLLINPFEK